MREGVVLQDSSASSPLFSSLAFRRPRIKKVARYERVARALATSKAQATEP